VNRTPAPSRLTLANALTAGRLFVAAPALLVCAYLEARTSFLWVLAASFASDAIDGTVARLAGGGTPFGALLDSWADAAAYTAIAVGIVVLWPEVVRAHGLACATVLMSLIVPSLIAVARFKRFTSYHTWLVKLAAATVTVALLIVLAGGPAWPFQLAAFIALLAACEEIAITCLLDEPRSNIRSVFDVWHVRRTR